MLRDSAGRKEEIVYLARASASVRSNRHRLCTDRESQVMWDDVIGEPEGIRSPECAWRLSGHCFRLSRGCCYVLLSVLVAPLLALCLGFTFACLSFQVSGVVGKSPPPPLRPPLYSARNRFQISSRDVSRDVSSRLLIRCLLLPPSKQRRIANRAFKYIRANLE